MEVGVLAGPLGVLRLLICLPPSAEEACADVGLYIGFLLTSMRKKQLNVGKQLV